MPSTEFISGLKSRRGMDLKVFGHVQCHIKGALNPNFLSLTINKEKF